MPKADHEIDEQWMRRAIRLAMNGRGAVEPNPMVGCVLVKRDRVIGEGIHRAFGEGHAEPTALKNCTESPEGATAYVTLEPCCHLEKKTPPCVPALIAAKIARVVAGCVDPNPSVNGQGLEQLSAAGLEVSCNVLEDEAKQLLAPFIAREVYGRPYVTLKWAETSDGKVAGPKGTRLQITNDKSNQFVHQLRGRSDAIVIGVNTAITDDPQLTARDVDSTRPIARIVLDRNLRLPMTSKLVLTAREIPTLVYCATDAHAARVDELSSAGVELLFGNDPEKGDALEAMLRFLANTDAPPWQRAITHVLVEPGPKLAAAMFAADVVDRVWLFRSPKRVDDASAPSGPGVPGDFLSSGEIDFDGDRLTEYLNPRSAVFFSASSSADLVLAHDEKI